MRGKHFCSLEEWYVFNTYVILCYLFLEYCWSTYWIHLTYTDDNLLNSGIGFLVQQMKYPDNYTKSRIALL